MRYFHGDQLGSTRVITDAAGAVITEYMYAPFGEKFGTGAPPSYGFTGKPEDAGTGLQYFGARFYDPEIGRFLTLDKLCQGLNRYAYCDNNPISNIDIDGNTYFSASVTNSAMIAGAPTTREQEGNIYIDALAYYNGLKGPLSDIRDGAFFDVGLVGASAGVGLVVAGPPGAIVGGVIGLGGVAVNAISNTNEATKRYVLNKVIGGTTYTLSTQVSVSINPMMFAPYGDYMDKDTDVVVCKVTYTITIIEYLPNGQSVSTEAEVDAETYYTAGLAAGISPGRL